ncbi:hypothetical protein GEV29_05720 [Aeromicrobium sp. SMF47]|uniref:Uncharacterized protein n=1 Tax=Aeromicrobium yanjiei TaxID=2662028 RepID=A0A5Q2MHZ6_9ACTN|nr:MULTISPECIES: hypothetical protein [Aeromicrobium]MRJ76027.1 hypothetical protein [Aeromicrobium yanjiei]MRK00377.1 hypothetical protein [Aeromicrobium sp. S22]QGG42747.1 hypothetical protein GEV26_15945 [Aeromicrobium yanjiei]
MTSVAVATRYPAPPVFKSADIAAKTGLLVLVLLALIVPGFGNLDGKGLIPRAIAYPLLAFAVPFIWFTWWRQRASFPWTVDFLVTFVCFSDMFGNALNLYDTVESFDNIIHFVNTGLLTAAFILLTMHRSSTLGAVLERTLAFGVSAALLWEIAEYFAFLRWSPERLGAYADTLSDMSLGALGSIIAGVWVYILWSRGRLTEVAPQLELAHQVRTAEVRPPEPRSADV